MVDPIQASSSIPLPERQTLKGSRDPLPPDSIEQQGRMKSEDSQKRRKSAFENFDDYLEQSAVTTLKRAQATQEYSVTDDIQEKSIYKNPGETTPI